MKLGRSWHGFRSMPGLCSDTCLVALVLLAWAIGGRAGAQQEGRGADPYAGKTVANFSFGQGMIVSRMKNAPRLGELAPNFLLPEVESGKDLRLGELCREKPVVLWFGSSTCGETARSIKPLVSLAQRYANKVQFVLVYIREAHAKDGIGFGPAADINDPKDYAERRKVAAAWKKRNKIPFPVLADGMGDPMAVRWAAWPVRLYVVDQQQKVVYAGQQGPWYYNPGKWYHHEGETNLVKDEDWQGISRESLEDFLEAY